MGISDDKKNFELQLSVVEIEDRSEKVDQRATEIWQAQFP